MTLNDILSYVLWMRPQAIKKSLTKEVGSKIGERDVMMGGRPRRHDVRETQLFIAEFEDGGRSQWSWSVCVLWRLGQAGERNVHRY